MSTTNNLAVQQLYVAYFNRPADGAGLDYWTNVLSSGGATIDQISAQFATSNEYKATYAGLNSDQIVDKVYMNLFGRHADNGGLQYWSAKLSEGVLTLSNVVTAVSTSAIAAGTGSDYSAITDKVSAADQFTTALQDNAAARLAYGTAGGTSVGVAYLASVTDDASLTTATNNLNTTLNNVITKGTPVTTLSLTTGIDNTSATGTGVNNFYASLDNNAGAAAATATLGGADSITGFGTLNNLILTDSVSTGYDTIPVGAVISNIQTVTLKTAGNAGHGAGAFDVSGLAGVTALNVTSSGGSGDVIKAAVTTDVTVGSFATTNAVTVSGGHNVAVTNNDGAVTVSGSAGAITVANASAIAATVVTVDSGSSVVVTETGAAAIKVDDTKATVGTVTINDTGALTGSTISVGHVTGAAGTLAVTAASAATGAVVVNNNFVASAGSTSNAITVGGGSTITVNNVFNTVSAAEAAALAVPGAGFITVIGGAITAVGGSTTTSVNINQSAAVAATVATATAASGGVTTTSTPVVGAPGVDAVAAVSTTSAVVAAKAASVAVADGAVVVADVAAASVSQIGTITSATVNNYSTLAIYDNALTTLNVSGGGNIGITSALTTTVGAPTALALTLNNVNGSFTNTFAGGGAGYKTLNVTTTGADSTLTSISDASLTTLNIAGTKTLTLSAVPTSLTTIAVSGAAGFNGDVSALTLLTSFTTTSSGTIAAVLDAAHQTFVGSTGQDIITVTAPAATAITGGSNANNEIIVNGAQMSMAHITNFSTYGSIGATGIYDFSVLTGFKAIDVQSIALATTLTKVAPGSALTIDALNGAFASNLTYQTNDASGANESVTLTVGSVGNANALTIGGTLQFQDANLSGIGTINLVSNSSNSAGNTFTSIIDNGLSKLNVTGAKPVTITSLTESTTQATSFTLNDAAGTTIGTFTDASLGNLSFAGTVASSITSLVDNAGFLSIANTNTHGATIVGLTDAGATGALSLTLNFSGSGVTTMGTLTNTSTSTTSLTVADAATASVGINVIAANIHITTESFSNTGSGILSIGSDLSATAATITLSGNVKYNNTSDHANSPVGTAPTTGVIHNLITTGVTVSGATDNAHVNLELTGSTAGLTDAITLGNANNYIVDHSSAGTVTVAVGTGSNLIDLSYATASTYSASVTLGAHTGPDQINVGVVAASAAAANTVISGAATGDIITFVDASAVTAQVTAAQQASISAASNIAQAIGIVDGFATAHSLNVFQFAGNTYVLESVAAGNGTVAAGDSIIELVGVHTLGATTTGVVHLAS